MDNSQPVIVTHRKDDQSQVNFNMKMYDSNTSIPPDQILSFDNMLNDMGFGKYQYWIYVIMGLNGITEGS